MIGGILEKADQMTAFLNPTENSYKRLGVQKAPGYISWSSETAPSLSEYPLRRENTTEQNSVSPDPTANPYLAFTLMIEAGLYGIKNRLDLPPRSTPTFTKQTQKFFKIKAAAHDLETACKLAAKSSFIKQHLPEAIHLLEQIIKLRREQWA